MSTNEQEGRRAARVDVTDAMLDEALTAYRLLMDHEDGPCEPAMRAALEAALSAQPAPSSKDAGFVEHIKLLDREVDSLRGVIATYEAAASGSDGVWFYQGDGQDFPQSLSCPVVMRADQFRELMAAQPAPERQGVVGEYVANIDQYGGILWRSVPPPHGTKLYTHPAAPVGVPDGWVPVPREPTDAMVDSALALQGEESLLAKAPALTSALVKIYTAMLAAAPSAPDKAGEPHVG